LSPNLSFFEFITRIWSFVNLLTSISLKFLEKQVKISSIAHGWLFSGSSPQFYDHLCL
jgi:hypothetical protein